MGFTPANSSLDIWFFDDDQNVPEYAFAITQTDSQECDAPCYDQIDECTGVCMNSSAIYYVNILMSYSEINLAGPYYGASPEELASLIAAHELGHALRLAHAPPLQHSCSEVQSVMYAGTLSVRLTCGVTAPNYFCDGNAVDALYASGVASCPEGGNYCDGEACN